MSRLAKIATGQPTTKARVFFPDSNVDTSFAPDAHLARHCALGRCRPSHSLALKRASPNRSSLFSNVAILLARFVSTWKVCQRHASMTFATDTILSTARLFMEQVADAVYEEHRRSFPPKRVQQVLFDKPHLSRPVGSAVRLPGQALKRLSRPIETCSH